MFSFLISSLHGYNIFETYVNSTTIYSGVEITGGALRNNGLTGYIGMIDSTYSSLIRKYNVSTGIPELLGEYEHVPNNNFMDRFFFYGEYMVGYSNTTSSYNVYNESSFAFLGSH